MTRHTGPVDDPGRYTVGAAPVAGGGQGFVYRGERTDDGQPVAVKQLTALPLAAWPGHERRLRAVAGLCHPSWAGPIDGFVGCAPFGSVPPDAEDFDIPYTVMAWVDGVALTDAVAAAGLADILGWVRDIAHAVAALHELPTPSGVGVAHRDVKPSNVLVTPERAVLVDYGTIRPVDGATATWGVGSPGWMPPEVGAGPGAPGPAGDVWQVGGLASWALLGVPPGATGPGRRARLARVLARRGARSARRLAGHIDGALAERPEDRPGDLRRWADDLVAGGRPRSRSRRALVAVAAAGVVLVPAGAARGPEAAATAEPSPTVALGHGPRDFGEQVDVIVTLPPSAVGARLRIEPRAGAGPVPGTAPLESVVDQRRVTYTFGALAPPGTSAVVVDRLVVELSPPGRPVRRHILPVDVRFAPALPPAAGCVAYDPSAVRRSGTDVVAGAVVLAHLEREVDADELLGVARAGDELCTIGPGWPDHRTTQFWRHGGRLSVPPADGGGADCHDYDPAGLALRVHAGGEPSLVGPGPIELLQLAAPGDGELALAVARHYRAVCFVGRYSGDLVDQGRVYTYWR